MSLAIPASTNRSLGSFLGGAIGAVGGFIVGGPGGAVAGAQAGSTIGGILTGTPTPQPGPTPPAGALPGKPIVGAGGGITVGGYGINIGGAFTGPSSGAPAGTAVATGCGMRGYHLNKKPLGVTHKHGALPAHSVYVRNRHMNAGNARAATRAIHRLKAAHRIFKKIDKIIGHHRTARRSFGRKR